MENRPEEAEGYEGNKRKKPDLVIEGKMPGRPEYEFEAKRLKKKDFGIGEYLGSKGLGCFVTGKYAARYNEAAMLGYIQSDSPEDWQVEIREKINRKKTILDVMSPPQDVEIISDFPNEWKTMHRREVIERSISIFHILLDFRSKGYPAAPPVL
ncbi:MAG: hypothetical protein KAW12_14040 [Candidatus Aminicenantes bacterium]|nr:hypothetical protein [Candidatus Aminicenantes bacterium]